MSNKFCRYLSNGLTIWNKQSDNHVSITPCCIFKNAKKVDLTIENDLTRIRQEFAQITEWTDECFKCKQLEDIEVKSFRQSSFDRVLDDNNNNNIQQLELMFDINCNAACVICDPGSSTLWIKEKNKILNKNIPINTIATEAKIKKISNSLNLESLNFIKFFGGEPLFTDTHYKFLKQIKNPENITLQYTTNGSIYPKQEVIDLWSKFKLVLFCVSADGIEKQFDYIRWPLNWSKVVNNLLKLRSHAPNNMMFRFEYTVNFLNAFYFKEFEDWVKQNFASNRLGDLVEINIHPYYGDIWNLQKISNPLYDKIINKYGTNHKISKLISEYKLNENLESWRTFVNQWDTHRQSKWQDAFPELTDLYE